MRKIYLLCVLLISAVGCEKEENMTIPVDNGSVELVPYEDLPANIKSIFTSTTNEAKSARGKFGRVRTEVPANRNYNENGKANYTLLLDHSGGTKSPNSYFFDNLVINELEDGGEKLRVLRYVPEESWYADPEKSFGNYSGSVIFFDIEGNRLGKVDILNGKPMDKSANKANDVVEECIYIFYKANCVGWTNNNCTYYYKEECTYTSGSSGGDGDGGGAGDPPTGGTGTWGSGDNNTGGGPSGDDGGNNGDLETTPLLPMEPREPVEEKIDTSSLDNDCVEEIIAELQEKDSHLSVIPDLGTEVSHISQIILDLFDHSQNFHLSFQIDDATRSDGMARNAYTIGLADPFTGKFTWTITLDDNYVENATQLGIARTIIHESLHGYLGYLYQNDPSTSFMQKLNRYRRDKGGLGEHEFMIQFTEALGASLAAWDNHSIPKPVDPTRRSYYEALAWSGDMLNTSEFNDLDEDFQNQIEDANENEGNALNEAKNDSKGSKCP